MRTCLIYFYRAISQLRLKGWSFSFVNIEWYFERLLFYFGTIYSAFCLFYNQDPGEDVSDCHETRRRFLFSFLNTLLFILNFWKPYDLEPYL